MTKMTKMLLIALIVGLALTIPTAVEAKRGGHRSSQEALLAAPACSVAPDPAPRWSWVQVTGSGFIADTFGDVGEFTDTIYSVVITGGVGVGLTGTSVQPDGTIALDYFLVHPDTTTFFIWKDVDGVEVSATCTVTVNP